ncbi:unnamed protein product [Owenia fusiformis]|uniref:Uncharacterized protein n=1 Tax=Owenia fusiformis TaxID=6347 RepID=A0A8J1U1E8_OWEFU|nr:unnamed protein product [Owenia fusiformis]
MANIRETIELLTRVLKDNGTRKIKAEVFRLAKFDNEAAVEPLWIMLFELTYFCKFHIIDDVCVKAVTELSTNELVIYVKKEMQKTGFYSRDFASLPNDMTKGARELLLAFGWLVCKENIMDKFMENCSSPVADDLYTAKDDEGTPRPVSHNPAHPADKVKYLLWLNGKLRMTLRNLFAMQKQNAVLTHKVHESTYGTSLSPDMKHLSALEVYMLRHPELLKKNLQLLEKDNERLRNLLVWKEVEDTFWRWMESVLDIKLQESSKLAEAVGFNQDTSCTSSVTYELLDEPAAVLQESHNKLRDAIYKYESIIGNLENLWAIKSSEVSQEDLDKVLASIELEISIQEQHFKKQVTPVPSSSTTTRPVPPTLSYVKNPMPVKLTNRYQPMVTSDKIRDIQGEIHSLKSLVDKLEGEIQKERRKRATNVPDLQHVSTILCTCMSSLYILLKKTYATGTTVQNLDDDVLKQFDEWCADQVAKQFYEWCADQQNVPVFRLWFLII